MRVRSTKRYGIGRSYPSREEFLSDKLGEGLHTLHAGNLLVDLLIKNRQSPTTIVFFHASVTRQTTYPLLIGDGIARAAGANLISLSDPVLAYTDKVRLGWFLGVKPIGSFPDYAVPLIKHAAGQLNTQRLIFAGSSGGGFAAMNFGQHFDRVGVLCINPRLNLGARPVPKVADYLVHGFRASGRTQLARLKQTYVQEDSAKFFNAKGSNQVGIIQNSGDHDYYYGQLLPFVKEIGPNPNLWVRTDYIGEGHVPYPKPTLHGIVKNLADTTNGLDVAFRDSGFQNPV